MEKEENRRFRIWLIKKAWLALKAKRQDERLAEERILEQFVKYRRPGIVHVYRWGRGGAGGGCRIVRKWIEEDVTVHPEEA